MEDFLQLKLVWMICRATDKSCLLANLSNEVKGLFIFSTSENALAFTQAEGIDSTYSVVAQTMTEFAKDLGRHFQSGVSHVLLDSQSGGTSHHAISILSILMELDKPTK